MKRIGHIDRTAALRRGGLAVRSAFAFGFALTTSLWSRVAGSDCGSHESAQLGMVYARPNQPRQPQGFGTLVQV